MAVRELAVHVVTDSDGGTAISGGVLSPSGKAGSWSASILSGWGLRDPGTEAKAHVSPAPTFFLLTLLSTASLRLEQDGAVQVFNLSIREAETDGSL